MVRPETPRITKVPEPFVSDRKFVAPSPIESVTLAAPIATALVSSVLPGMPSVVDPANVYSEATAGHLSPAVADALPRVYVPNRRSGEQDTRVNVPSDRPRATSGTQM